jgi:hypothetical protein
MSDNPNPTGAVMIKRQEIEREMVRHALIEYPPCRGDDTLLIIYVWVKNYPKLAAELGNLLLLWVQPYPRPKVSTSTFKAVLLLPATESLRRRRQEIHEQAEAEIESQLVNLKGAERYLLEEELRAKSKVLPSLRVKEKRDRLERAMYNYYGSGELDEMDYIILQ